MPRRFPTLTTLACLGLLAAGCGSDTGSSKVVGSTLTAYAGLPLNGQSGARGQAIENGMKLALAAAGGRAGGHRVEAVYLDDTSGRPPRWSQATSADDARRASQDNTAIGYLGDVESGATRVSLPITNQAEMAQISPASTAVDLTRGAGGKTPERLQSSGKRTFARVVPADDVQAHAGAVWAKRLGAKRVATLSSGEAFGDVVTVAFEDQARELGLDIVTAKSDPELLYVGGSGARGLATLRKAASLAPGAKLMGSDALVDPVVLDGVGALAPRLYIISPFIDPSRLPRAGERFVTAYRDRFGEPPDPVAAYGYESMALLLDAIRRAGENGDDRGAVIDQVLATRGHRSVLGTYSIDKFGDTTLRAMSGYRLRGGGPVFETQLEAPGP